jgi:N4-gp56 family major capsid protein
MGMQQYATPVASRNTQYVELKLLKEVETIQALGKFGMMREHPQRNMNTVSFRRLDPFNMSSTTGAPQITPANFIYAEGTTPDSNTVDFTDVTVTLNNYDVLYKYSSDSALMYEDNIPDAMIRQTSRVIAEIAELVAYGQVKSGSSVIYANGSARSSVNSKITLPKLRQAVRAMSNNRATPVTSMIKSGPDFGTGTAPEGYIVFCSTDCSADIRDLPNFTSKESYGTAVKMLHNREIGVCEEFRFIVSPLFTPFLAGGAAVGTTGMLAADDTTLDVYPMVVMAEDAWGHVSLKGYGYSGITPTHIRHDQKNHANPAGKFGYVGAGFYYNAVRLNENWMQRIEVCVTDLDA